MSKVNKYIICILLIILLIIISAIATRNIVWGKAYARYNPKISSIYADIVYSFSDNKKSELLQVSTIIIANEIIYLGKNTQEVRLYRYLCPYLDIKFKNILIKNYSENNTITENQKDKEDFFIGYDKVTEFCHTSSSK